MIKLTRRQQDIMNILWESDTPLIASEIEKRRDDLNINTVQSTLRTLVKKNYVEIADIVYSGTVLSRSYRPLIKREQVWSEFDFGVKNILSKTHLFAQYVDEINDLDTILSLEETLQKKKKELEKK